MTKPNDTNTIYIIGTKNFYHEALSYVLEHEIEATCCLLSSCDSIQQDRIAADGIKNLILINYLEKEFESELMNLEFRSKSYHDIFITALFNLQRGTGIEKRAFSKGIRGFFYRDDNLSHLMKGLQALLQGEIWISRDILVEVALKSRSHKSNSTREKNTLTEREMEILALVSIGSANDEIADKLFISPHTVKTHLYKIFQKINVPNRLQAALWAAKNM